MSGTNPEKPPIQPEQQLYPHPTGDNTYQQQHQQQQQPPQYTSGATQYNPDQKSELPGGHGAQTQQFPPPPPGPPPANQPQFTHAPQPQQQYNQTPQQSQQHYQAPPQGQHVPGQHTEGVLPGANPGDYGAGRHYSQFDGPQGNTAPGHVQGGPYVDPAAAHAAYIAPTGAALDPSAQHKEKKGWGERLSQIGMKAAVPINALANKMGSQSFLPTTMDKECEKAAKIVRSFCKEGITSDVPAQTQASEHLEPGKHADGHGSRPTTPGKEKVRKEQKAIVKIPSKVINKAVGLAVFTTARVGFNFSGATGSGVLIARLPDGSWSPPSGIQVHALGAGFMIGIDIYDCVCVINSREALAAFMSTRVSLGPDVAVVAGPYGAGGVLDVGASFGGKNPEDKKTAEQADAGRPVDDGKLRPDEKNKRRSSSSSIKPVFSYVKSRGFYAGIQVDGTVVTERKDANAAFYGQKVTVDQIVRGQVPPQGPGGLWPTGAQALYEALRVAEQQKPLPEVHLPQAIPGQVPPQGSIPQQQQQYSGQQAQYGTQQPQQSQYGQPQYGQPQYTNSDGGPLGSHPPGQGPTASGALNREEQLPGYVDDGVARPGVGDHKGHYQ
ncbi:LAS seventeen-binding protein [Colletotrichum higginsianum IMI 349063]|uniref:LAS seventeen-binding protein n=1 Tax=Colletotrichum higginsianum (strain IMI 349063) TaxID=759273 RepID=A0A1B7Y3F9_COLHI|nr:LAS seventeen-binding protein [Colletotrichum higginsianum IMI 349063]OBR06560.1 LAS seventeen-binding protein [Colletotrichum higginsianum IMI 349063]